MQQISAAERAFLGILGTLLEKFEKKHPEIIARLREARQPTAVDVGCGYMRYGKALKIFLAKINPNTKVFAVDKVRMNRKYEYAEFIKCNIEELKLKRPGMEIEIFTVFNPFPGVPRIRHISGKGSLLIGCVDWNKPLFESTLTENGFKPVTWQENRQKDKMKGWFNNYDPFVMAVRI